MSNVHHTRDCLVEVILIDVLFGGELGNVQRQQHSLSQKPFVDQGICKTKENDMFVFGVPTYPILLNKY